MWTITLFVHVYIYSLGPILLKLVTFICSFPFIFFCINCVEMSLSVIRKKKRKKNTRNKTKTKTRQKRFNKREKSCGPWCLRTDNEINSAGRRSTRFLPVEKNGCVHIYCLGSVCSNGFRTLQSYRKERNSFNGVLKVIAYWLTSCFKIGTLFQRFQ